MRGFVQRQLRADCSDERTHLLMWTQVALAGFMLGEFFASGDYTTRWTAFTSRTEKRTIAP